MMPKPASNGAGDNETTKEYAADSVPLRLPASIRWHAPEIRRYSRCPALKNVQSSQSILSCRTIKMRAQMRLTAARQFLNNLSQRGAMPWECLTPLKKRWTRLRCR